MATSSNLRKIRHVIYDGGARCGDSLGSETMRLHPKTYALVNQPLAPRLFHFPDKPDSIVVIQ